MNEFDRRWSRLTALARAARPVDESGVAPHGFAVRVAARWVATRRAAEGPRVWEWLAVRGLAVACALSVTAAFAAWPSVESGDGETLAAMADPLSLEELAP